MHFVMSLFLAKKSGIIRHCRSATLLVSAFGLNMRLPAAICRGVPCSGGDISGNPMLILGDVDPLLAVASSRIYIIFIILLLCVSIVVFFVVMQLAKESAARVAASESRFRAIFESAPEMILIVDSASRNILAANPVATRWLGYSASELDGMSIDQLLANELSPTHEPFDLTLPWKSAFTREFRYQRKDGTVLDVELTGTHINYRKLDCLLVFVRDSTQRKEAERQLQYRLQIDTIITSLSTQFINCPAEGINQAIHTALRQIGEFTDVDRCFVYLLSDDGLTLRNTHEWHAEGSELRVALKQQLSTARFPWWMEHLRSNEHILISQLSDLPSEASEERDILGTFGIKSCLVVPITSNYAVLGFLGIATVYREKCWSDEVILLLRIIGEIFINTITRARAEQEIRQLNTNLARRVNELNAANHELESFSYSVSHDLRSPLRCIDGFSHMLWEDYAVQLDAQGKEYIDYIRTSCTRMEEIIDDMLNLAHVTRSEMQRSRVDLSNMVQEIAAELQKKDPGRQVEFMIPPRLMANGDHRLLRLALENLLSNAWKFTGTRECAHIEFSMREDAGRSVYCVRDNGVGFDPTRAGRLFRAFQRLHSGSQFPGTGVGLATVQRIIDRHGGSVWAESEVGKGAAFYFTLPS